MEGMEGMGMYQQCINAYNAIALSDGFIDNRVQSIL